MSRAFLIVGLGLALVACDKPYDNGYAVDLIIDGDGTVELTKIKTLDFQVSGAETFSSQAPLDHPFESGEERRIYRPGVQSGDLTFDVRGLDAGMAILGSAHDTVTLVPGKTVTKKLTLSRKAPDGGVTGLLVDRVSFDFGTFVSGQNATPHIFTVTNATDASTGPVTAALGGAGASSYSIESDTCSGKSLDARATCTLAVRLKTTNVGTPMATLGISAMPPGAATVALSGTVVPPGTISVAPAAADFGSIAQGQTATAISLEVRNDGLADTGPLAITIAGDDGPLFGMPLGCAGMTLASGASCTVTVSFAPPAAAALGMKSATLRVEGMPGGIGAAELRGSVIMPGALGVTPGLYDFGKITIGQASPTSSYIVTNTGSAPTGSLSTARSGDTTQFEVVSDKCQGQALPAGGTCQIDVRFKPTQAGTPTLGLTVSGTPGGAVSASAIGTGGDFVTLTVSHTGAAGAVSAEGISCGGDCTEKYDRNSMVTLTALPDLASRFGAWSGAACPMTTLGTCTITMDGDKTVGASFVTRPLSNIAFVTSTTITPMSLGAGGADPLAAADAVCATRAVQGGLSGTYKALLATSTVSAASRLGAASGWVRTDGKAFAASQADLVAGKILYPLRIDETGTAVADDPMDMTGTATVATGADKAAGSTMSTCADWTAAGTHAFGVASGGTDTWIALATTHDCSQPAHLYCFETTYSTGVTLTPPSSFRRVFLSAPHVPMTVSGADTACNTDKAMLTVPSGGSGNYYALLAPNGQTAGSLMNQTNPPWIRPDGVQLAPTTAGTFMDSIAAAVNVTADGQYIGNAPADFPYMMLGAQAGVTAPGVSTENCASWTSGTSTWYGGQVAFSDKRWSTGYGPISCANAAANSGRFLCFEQ